MRFVFYQISTGSVCIRAQRPCQFLHEEQLARHGRNAAGGHGLRGAVAEGHPEAHALPLHTARQHAVRAADGVVRAEDDLRADGIRIARDEWPRGAEGRDGILLDGEWVESCPNAARLCQPCFLGFIFIGSDAGSVLPAASDHSSMLKP